MLITEFKFGRVSWANSDIFFLFCHQPSASLLSSFMYLLLNQIISNEPVDW